MTYQFNQRELNIHLETGEIELSTITRRIEGNRIIGPVDYGWAKFLEASRKSGEADPLVMTWGGGPLAGSRIPGSRRLVFTGYSPLWESFYVSSFGGGAFTMHRVGVDFISIHGAAPQDSVLILNHYEGQVHVRLEPVNPDLIWNAYPGPEGERLIGVYALQQAVLDRYASEYPDPKDGVRVFVVGPAARNTNQGIIGSNPVRKGLLTPIDDWAGRGGLGSRLLQKHHIAACIFGGDWEDPDLKDSKEIDSYFQTYYNESMIKVDLGATEKYRYVPGFQTGGTFGVNMHTAGDNLFSFNYTSIFQPDEKRLEQHREFILNHYLKQFNKEIIAPRNFAHCGEPCSVACKKYDREFKKDYEPYQALGPLVGVFDQRAAESLNHFVDALGIDAIQTGGTAAWLMELVWEGLIDPREYGLPAREVMKFGFASNPAEFDLVADSSRNAAYAQAVVEMILFSPQGEPFRQGIRIAARWLDEAAGPLPAGQRPSDRAVYTSHGEQGGLTPNQYWVPGMFSPMPLMGKYFVYYGVDWVEPRELGQRCVHRMVYELFNENSGICRFHRKWAESIVDEIISSHYKFPLDYKAHQFELARQIYARDGQASVFWESQRTIDIIAEHIEKWVRFGLKDASLHEWAEHFRADRYAAARQYWEQMSQGIADAFAAGPEAIPDMPPPYKAAKLDVMSKR